MTLQSTHLTLTHLGHDKTVTIKDIYIHSLSQPMTSENPNNKHQY